MVALKPAVDMRGHADVEHAGMKMPRAPGACVAVHVGRRKQVETKASEVRRNAVDFVRWTTAIVPSAPVIEDDLRDIHARYVAADWGGLETPYIVSARTPGKPIASPTTMP